MRILVLEDDATLGPWLEQGLRTQGHVVDLMTSGRDALTAAMTFDYDVFIFDRMVPDLDGLSVLKALRQAKNRTPALFLTALGEVDDRVEGLDAGGDDYLVKPFAFSELTARLNALARRPAASPAQDPAELRVGDLTLHLHKRQCFRQGQAIDLNPKEFLLLEAFMRAPGRIQTKTMLLERVWDLHFDPTTSLVETHISRLRAKIEKPFGGTLIKTVRGAGYLLASDD